MAADSSTEWRRSNWTTIRYCLIVALGAVLFGFDAAAISGLIALDRFNRDFGERNASTGVYTLSAGDQTLLYGMLVVGAWLASLVSGLLGSRYGRKAGLYACAGFSLIGPVIQIVAPNMGVMVLGRVLTGAGIGFAVNFSPVYWAEVTPARYRGLVVMLYQSVANVTTFIGACIIQGVHTLQTKWAWRTPLFVMMATPLVMLALIPLLPETPRWYITQNRRADATASLIKLRGPTWPASELEQEIEEIVHMYELERNLEGSTTFADCFRSTNARRTRITVLVALTQSWTGISFLAGYGTIFFAMSGLPAFLITVITSLCGLVGSAAAFPLVRWVGRRKLLLWGAVACGLCMLLFAIVGTARPDSTAASTCLVVFVCLYLFTYGATWGPLPMAVASEVASNGLRSKTMSMMNVCAYLTNLFIDCGSPYLINEQYVDIGSKLGFIFGGTMVVGVLWMFFELPETKDRTLEEIDEMFMNRIPARAFKDYVCTGAVVGRDEEVPQPEKEATVTVTAQ